jgi:hypothetical protein
MKQKSTPGPGDYVIEHHRRAIDPTTTKGGTVYRPPSRPTKHAIAAHSHAPKLTTPGPGAYDTERYFEYTKPPERAVTIVPQEVSESKVTPQLERKRYWEEKARDARDDHDNCQVANDSMTRPRVPVSVIRPPTQVGVDWRNRKIMRERQAERDRLAQGGGYEVNHSLVERRTLGVDLGEGSHPSKAQDKPGVRRVLAAKAEEDRAREKFYGPQLHVNWVDDRHAQRAGKEEEDEDMDEVVRFLADRQKRDPHDPRLAEAVTAAFLRSSYTAAPAVKALVMRPDSGPTARSAAERDKEFIGPQLQVGWCGVVCCTDWTTGLQCCCALPQCTEQYCCTGQYLQCCCAVLCCAVLCCAVRCCAVLCCAVLCCAVLCCAVLCCAVLCLLSF